MLFLQNFSKKSKWSQIIFCRNVLSDEGWGSHFQTIHFVSRSKAYK